MRIGAIDFLNAFPLYYYLARQGHQLIYDVPSSFTGRLNETGVDAALLSSIEYSRNAGRFKYIPGLCISSSDRVESIRLFVHPQTDIEKTALSRIYVDYATKSSIAMLKVILAETQKTLPAESVIRPPYAAYIENLKQGEAVLLIGDAALKERQRPSIDLGRLYSRIFGRAMVYALWLYHTENPVPAEEFTRAYRFFDENRTEVYRAAAERFSFDPDFVKGYLEKNIEYILSEEKEADMRFFFERVSEVIRAEDRPS